MGISCCGTPYALQSLIGYRVYYAYIAERSAADVPIAAAILHYSIVHFCEGIYLFFLLDNHNAFLQRLNINKICARLLAQ